ncbi:MAG: DNA-binding protein [Planctomycetes bacterium]|nr:DNA-binding protein [Planctomycetota bacterium]
MPTVTLKNVPADLYDRLRRAAEAHRRTVTNEIIACLERALGGRTTSPEAILARARKLREKTLNCPISDDEFTGAKAAGRL